MAGFKIDSDQAVAALAAVHATRRRSAELRGYAGAGKHLIAWGLVWLAGNLAAQFMPSHASWVWSISIVCAVAFQLASSYQETDWRVLATVGAGLGFFAISIILFEIGPALQTAYGSLIVAAIYIVLGVWIGARFAWLGLVVAGIVIAGRLAFPLWLPLWLGIGGGGALILSGLWLRRA
jgi:hypothetical protein